MIRLPVTTGLLAALLTLGGCSLLPESEPVAVYQYSQPPQDLSQQRRQSLPLSLRVDTPQAGYAHTGPRLMVQTRDNQLLSYRGVRWSDPTPTLLREYLVQAFQRQGGLRAVTTDENALHADVHLGSDLRRFQVVDGEQPHILIELQARLVNPESRRIYVSRDFRIEQPIGNTQIAQVLEGHERAAQTLARQLLDWALPQLAAIPADSRP